MVLNTNIQALKTSSFLSVNTANLAKSLSRLSSGSKIVTPSDDAAGLAVSTRLASQIARNEVAYSNVTNAVSFTQTQEGLLATIDKALRRMADLSIFSQDSTKSLSDLGLYSKEFGELQEFISKSIEQKFNGINLFSSESLSLAVNEDGSIYKLGAVNLTDIKYQNVLNKPEVFNSPSTMVVATDSNAKTITLTVSKESYENAIKSDSLTLSNLGLTNGVLGPISGGGGLSSSDSVRLQLMNGTYTIKSTTPVSTSSTIYSVTLDASGSPSSIYGSNVSLVSGTNAEFKTGFDITTPERAQSALTRVKFAIDSIAQTRASLGAVQSRLTMTNEQLRTTNENLSAATSRITDTDVADESTSYAKLQILIQSGTSMLAQANKMPQYALQLLQ
ncbi:MAG: flagellin [Verrucomicrobia bacterium]|nr:flagellin [Verrucomicrobiota bacterium]